MVHANVGKGEGIGGGNELGLIFPRSALAYACAFAYASSKLIINSISFTPSANVLCGSASETIEL